MPSPYDTSIDAILSASPSGDYASVFSTLDMVGGCVWNTNLFGGGGATLDFSGVGWTVTGGAGGIRVGVGKAVAISRRHIICSQHGSASVSENLHFVKPNGTIYTTAAIDDIEGVAGDLTTAELTFRVLYLPENLPAQHAVYPIISDPPIDMIGLPLIKFNQDLKAYIGKCLPFAAQNYHMGLVAPTDDLRLTYYRAAEGGDSGSSVFALLGTQLLYACGLTTLNTAGGDGPWAGDGIDEIITACATLDARNANTGARPTRRPVAKKNSALNLSIGI